MNNSEYAINNRRKWKAEVFPYDDFIPDGSQECQYCLTEKQAEILRGIVEPLAWKTRWWSDVTEVNQDEIQTFRDDIIRRLMMSCCGDEGLLFQYSSDGVLQESDDGGVTWVDVPEKDVRNNSPRFPPLTGTDGTDKKCTAAEGMVTLLKEQIGNQLTDDMSRYTLLQLITDWVKTMIATSNPFTALLTVITNQIFALVIATLRPALTDETYDNLKCIFFCNMEDDATFTESEWETIRSRVLSDITGIAGIFYEHIIYLLGVAGLTNLARAQGALSGDCGACDCLSFCGSDWAIVDGRLDVPSFDGVARTISGDATYIAAGGQYYFGVAVPFDACCYVEIDFDRNPAASFVGDCTVDSTLTLDEAGAGWIARGSAGVSPGTYRGLLCRDNAPFHVTMRFST